MTSGRGESPRDRVQVYCSLCHRAIYVSPEKVEEKVVCQVCQADSALDVRDATYQSGMVGKTCPFCMSPVKGGEQVVVCPDCSTPHHLECWMENEGHCSVYGCRGSTLGSLNRFRDPAVYGEVPLHEIAGSKRHGLTPSGSKGELPREFSERPHPIVYWFWGIVILVLFVMGANFYYSWKSGDLILNRAERAIRYGDLNKAIDLLEEHMTRVENLSDENELRLLGMLGRAFEEMGNDYLKKAEYDWAKKSYEKSSGYYGSAGDRMGVFRSSFLIANCLYEEAEDDRGYITGREAQIEEARAIYEEAIEETENEEDSELLTVAAQGYYNLGLIDYSIAQYFWDRTQWRNKTDAERYFRQASRNFSSAFAIDPRPEYMEQRRRAESMIDEIRLLSR